jgi:hypothetical protein
MSDSSGISDFINQVGGLLALTCVAGIIWLIMFGLIMQRANERRRREKEGLPPLPAFHVVWWQRIKQALGSQPPTPRTEPDYSPRLTTANAPKVTPKRTLPAGLSAPDLSLLTSDFSAPTPVQNNQFTPEPFEAFQSDEPVAPLESTAEPVESTPLDSPTEEPLDSVELLRVWRDLSTGSLVLEIGGQRFTSLGHLRSADLERRFVSVVRELDGLVRPAGAPPSPAPRPTIAPATDKDELPPPSMRPGAMFRQMTRAAMGQNPTAPEVSAPQTIADQIEDLLQARLVDLHSFQGRTIHVRPSVEGGVRIEIDGKFYDGIGDVDDPDVRELLGEVVREWESKQ